MWSKWKVKQNDDIIILNVCERVEFTTEKNFEKLGKGRKLNTLQDVKWIEYELKCQYNFFILIINVIFTSNNILNYSTNCPSAKTSRV